MEGTKKIKSTSFHQYSWNSEVETTWISLISWHHKTSTKYWVKQCSKVIFPSEVPIVLGKCLSKSYHVGRKIVTYNLISKSIGRKSKRKFYVWPSIPIPVWLFIVLYAQAGGLTHWLVMPFTLWSGENIDFIWLIDKHEIKIVCKNNKWCLLFFSKLVI